MKFYNPVIQLGKETGELADKYFLLVVTFCSRSNFQADGFSVNDEELPNGLLKVTVNLKQVAQLPNFEFITPIVHHIDLREVAFPFADCTIAVTVSGTVFQEPTSHSRAADAPPTTVKTGGTGTVSTTQADDKIRPADDPTLFGFCR
jgi:hypothetical protein